MNDFIRISKYAGMREDLVQSGGGNSSYKKTSDEMLIKASGYPLADISDTSGYAIVNPRIIRDAFMDSKDIDSLTELDSKRILEQSFLKGKKPSIETFLHAVSGTYTLHTHPIMVNAITCRKGGMRELEKMFPEALMIPYATPGIELAKAYFKVYKAEMGKKKGNIAFLQNHGLVVSGSSALDVISRTEDITRMIEKILGRTMDEYHNLTLLWEFFKEKILWKVTDENIIRVYKKVGVWNHTFCPDCVVFLGKKMLILREDYGPDDIDVFMEKYGQPIVVGYKNALYIVADNIKKALEIQSILSFSAQVMELNTDVECTFLTTQEQDFLLDWDVEIYRKNIK